MLFIFGSCSKEKDISKQIVGKWAIDEMMINNTNVLYPMSDLSAYDIEMEYDKNGDFSIKMYIGFGNYSYMHYFIGEWEATDTHLSLHYYENEIGCLTGVFIDANNMIENYEITNITKDKLSLTNINEHETITVEAKQNE